jgi:hypothetical protein
MKNKNMQIVKLISDFIPYKSKEDIKKLDDNLWYILDSSKNNNYNLEENDIIQFGSLKYLISKIHINDNIIEKNNNYGYENINKGSEPPFMVDNEFRYPCKFCDNYNLQLCNCGKLLHVTCFEKFIKKNIKKIPDGDGKNVEKKNVIIYEIDNYFCKKCETFYPLNVGNYNIITLDDIEFDNYIIIENFGLKNPENKKYIYILNLGKDVIKIGKNSDNDLIINDNSIDDEHATIYFDDKKNVVLKSLKELNTSVLIRGKVIFNTINKEIDLKLGNYYITAKMMPK